MVMVDRRKFIKGAGLTTASSIGLIAGCTGGGDNSDGSDNEGGGDGGNGGQTGQGGSGDGMVISQTVPPINYPAFSAVRIRETGTLQKRLEDLGYGYELTETWEGPALFASDQAQVSNIGALEAFIMGKERDFQPTIVNKYANSFLGMLTKRGSDWDPANTGSPEETLNKVIDEGANIGIAGWGSGSIPAYNVVFHELIGQAFSPDNSNLNVVTTDLFAMPDVINNEEVAIGSNAPLSGSAPYMSQGDDSPIVPVLWPHKIIEDKNLGVPPLTNLCVKNSFATEHPEALRAIADEWDKAYSWAMTDGVERFSQEEIYSLFGAESEEDARYAYNWSRGVDVPFSPGATTYYENNRMTDEYINNVTKYMDHAASLGIIDSSWNEFVTFTKLNS